MHKPQPNGNQKATQTQIRAQNASRQVMVGKSATTTNKEQENNAFRQLRKIYSSHATLSIQPQPASATEPQLQLETASNNVVNSKAPQ
jgi:hypothetical protein